MRIWPKHLYSLPNFNGRTGLCASGARVWFAAHDIDWADFVAHGIEADALLATGDALALRVVEHAREQEASNDG